MLDITEKARATQYKRPKSPITLTKTQREGLLREYFDHYRAIAKKNTALLNQKLPREISKAFLDVVGSVLLDQTKDLALKPETC
jgi:hypothetical protein